MENSKQSAFPIPCEQAIGTGLTKREYFAGLAMQGLCASGQYEDKDKQLIIDGLAEDAIGMADELLKQLGE